MKMSQKNNFLKIPKICTHLKINEKIIASTKTKGYKKGSLNHSVYLNTTLFFLLKYPEYVYLTLLLARKVIRNTVVQLLL